MNWIERSSSSAVNIILFNFVKFCFNTQPPEGGCKDLEIAGGGGRWFQHTATRRWLLAPSRLSTAELQFQHTATRRWLQMRDYSFERAGKVSTHSHPKVAAVHSITIFHQSTCFNTLPPEGGCLRLKTKTAQKWMFQHTATRRWLQQLSLYRSQRLSSFNTQPPEGGCSLHKKARKISKLNTVFR